MGDDQGQQDGEPGDDGLARYRQKRRADATGEPFGAAVAATDPAGRPRLFVVQQHAARRMHWDLRLEIRGVLRSWAIPRGPSPDPTTKRLAVETEDHPIEYVDFEGVIPAGNYGAGAMIVWDRGVYVPLEPIETGYAQGKLLFELRGHKLRGVWTLVRTKGNDDKQWLLIKKPDASAVAGAHDTDHYDPTSVLSGLRVEDVAAGRGRAARLRAALAERGVPRRVVDVSSVAVMLAEIHDEAFSDPNWLFELKYDGYRLLGARVPDGARLRYRSGRDATDAYPEIERAMAALPGPRLVLDGEVVVLDDDARPNFGRLQRRAALLRSRDIERGMREHPVTYYAFDLLAFDDFDLRGLPLHERKEMLRELLPSVGFVRYADHVPHRGEELMAAVRSLGVEGIVAKRRASAYVEGRCSDWKKIRLVRTDDFVVIGYTRPHGRRTGLSALVLAAHDAVSGALLGTGKVGTGFSDAMLESLRAALDPLAREHSPAARVPAGVGRDVVWVEPALVAEVRYKHRTEDGQLRHPVFVRLRDDKLPADCVLAPEEHPAPEEPAAPEEPPAPEDLEEPAAPDEQGVQGTAGVAARRPAPAVTGPRRVTISNPDKVFWPDDGFTKLDLVEYYRAVAPWLLPYLQDRPLVLTRYPDGIDGKNFFQKNAPPYIPEWLRTKTMWSEHAQREIEYFVCDEVDALVYVANLATIPLHVWGSRLTDLQHPDWCILDLDPKGAPLRDVIAIARFIHDLCEQIELPAYCKTSGSTGLHVLIPLARRFTFEQCRMMAEVLARVTVSNLRDIATIERHVPKRKGKVYVDFLQNGHGRLLVSPLCVRPLPGAPVSTPLRWDEVVEGLDPRAFTIRTVLERLQARGEDPMRPLLTDEPALLPALDRLLARLEPAP